MKSLAIDYLLHVGCCVYRLTYGAPIMLFYIFRSHSMMTNVSTLFQPLQRQEMLISEFVSFCLLFFCALNIRSIYDQKNQ